MSLVPFTIHTITNRSIANSISFCLFLHLNDDLCWFLGYNFFLSIRRDVYLEIISWGPFDCSRICLDSEVKPFLPSSLPLGWWNLELTVNDFNITLSFENFIKLLKVFVTFCKTPKFLLSLHKNWHKHDQLFRVCLIFALNNIKV